MGTGEVAQGEAVDCCGCPKELHGGERYVFYQPSVGWEAFGGLSAGAVGGGVLMSVPDTKLRGLAFCSTGCASSEVASRWGGLVPVVGKLTCLIANVSVRDVSGGQKWKR